MRRFLLILALLSAPCFAASPSISQHALDRMVRYWRHVLRLDDWDCRAHFVPLAELPKGTMGFSASNGALRYLTISVLRPSDYQRAAELNNVIPKVGREIRRDIEDTVLHELIHLRLRQLVESDGVHLEATEELTVDRLTSALLAARKGTQ